MKPHRLSGLLILLSFLALSRSAAASHLQWFGYVAGADEDSWIDGTQSYANWSWVAYDAAKPANWLAARVDALAQRNMKAILDLGQLLWNPTGGYRSLYPDYLQRWNAWKSAHDGILRGGQVLAVSVRDEPFNFQTSMADWETAARMIRADYPNLKILLIEAADAVACASPCYFDQYSGQVQTVDWIGVEKYAIDPSTDPVFRSALDKMKWAYPGRQVVFSADGWWGPGHQQNFAPQDINYMRQIATKWYDVAQAEPSAVLLGFFIFAPFSEGVSSRDFPPFVLQEHARIGRLITGRTRGQLSLPLGRLEKIGVDGIAKGWACDPDGGWGEAVTVELRTEGYGYTYVLPADQPSEFFPQCRSGIAHRFQVTLSIGTRGRRMTAYARDLDSGIAQLASDCLDAPACFWYENRYLPIGGFDGITATGLASGWACDRDAPASPIQIRIQTSDPSPQMVGVFLANLASEAAVNSRCGGGTAHRFSLQLPAWTKGQYLTVYGLDTMEGSAFLPTTAGSGCPAVGYCTW